MKRKIVLILLLINIILVTGCSGSWREDASNMLQAKYGETFTVTKYLGKDFKYKYYEVEAYSNNYPDIIFTASIENDLSGMSDSYGTKRLGRTISNTLTEEIKELDTNCYVYTEFVIPDYPVDDPNLTVPEMNNELEQKSVSIYIFLTEDFGVDEVITTVEKSLLHIPKFKGVLRIFRLSNQEIEEIKEYRNKEIREFDVEVKMSDCEIGRYRFENSEIVEEL